jgi:hypothetical protein
MTRDEHKIDEQYILGKFVKKGDYFIGKVIGIEFNNDGTMLFIIEPLDGSNIFVDIAEKYSFGKDPNTIPVSHGEIMEALEVVSKHRDSIANNISYAYQISGENTEQYRQELAKADQTCALLMKQIEKYKLVT